MPVKAWDFKANAGPRAGESMPSDSTWSCGDQLSSTRRPAAATSVRIPANRSGRHGGDGNSKLDVLAVLPTIVICPEDYSCTALRWRGLRAGADYAYTPMHVTAL